MPLTKEQLILVRRRKLAMAGSGKKPIESKTPVAAKVVCNESPGTPGCVSLEFGRCSAQPALILTVKAALPTTLITRWIVKEKPCASP